MKGVVIFKGISSTISYSNFKRQYLCGQVQIDYFSNVFQFDPNAIIFVNFG